MMNFTQEQIYEILDVVANEGGLSQLLQMSLESLMRAERQEFTIEHNTVSNGYRTRRAFGGGKVLELQVPRTRQGNFYPVILGLLRNQEDEMRRMAFKLYGAGLTTEQVGDLFGEIYGEHYSTSQVSRMFEYNREETRAWLNRPLDSYYPILYIDATYIPTRRVDSVSKEAYFTVLGVKGDKTREVLAVLNNPTEGSGVWVEFFEGLRARGVQEVGLVVSDALAGIEDSVAKVFPQADVQLCCVHQTRECLNRAKPRHKAEMAADLKEVFEVNNQSYTQKSAMVRWRGFCDKWSAYYPSFANKGTNPRYELYFTYLNYNHKIQSMIYTTNWIERLNRDYKRVVKMRGALPHAEAAILLLANVAMTRKAYDRKITQFGGEDKRFRWEN